MTASRQVEASRVDGRGPPSPLHALALSTAVLSGVGASLVLFVQGLAMPAGERSAFFVKNALGGATRRVLLGAVGLGALLPALVVLVALLVSGRRVAPGARRAASVLSPLLLAAFVPTLFDALAWHAAPLPYLLLLSAFVLAAVPLVTRAAEAWPASLLEIAAAARDLASPRVRRALPLALVLVGAAAYTAFAAYFTILTHRRIATSAFDLGIYDNLMWNALHGRPFRVPVLFGPGGGNYVSNHAEYAMLLFLPIYAIRPGPETLLVVQAALLGFAAVPLYLFASTQLSRAASVVVALAYLLYAPLHGPQFYDFHWLPLAIFFHFWLYWAIARKRTWLVAALVVVLFAIREDVAFGLATLGVFLFATRARPRLGLVLAAGSAAWFAVDKFVIMPWAGSWWFENIYGELFADGVRTYGSVVKTILTNPVFFASSLLREDKLVYALHMLAPLAFLPLRRLPLLVLLAPGFAFTLMTTGYAPTLSIAFQYTTHWIPYVFGATVLSLALLRRESSPASAARRRAQLGVMAFAMLSHSYVFGAVLQRGNFVGGFQKIEFRMTEGERESWRSVRELVAMIPQDASVAATEQEVPQISTRSTAYTLRSSPGAVDYILFKRSHLYGDARTSVADAFKTAPYGLLARRGDDLLLWKRGHESPETAKAKQQCGLP